MHGREGEENKRKRSRHMWTVSTRGNTRTSIVTAVDSSSSSLSSLSSFNSFCKDGRKISVGDCALFKPPEECAPFIGIIRWLTVDKENKFNLGVNWLYRPAEVKLVKGVLLEAAPNEIFYSFHKDEIPAETLLHPCKVAFLPKGVELPSGLSSYVCRRVYDITNKCLWWLTDQNYINERQEEVDKLLCKTQTEMHVTVHTGGRSPKPMNGPTSTSQLKSSSDEVQNTVSSFPSQAKGKKREHGDQGSEPTKRERSSKMDDGDFGQFRSESIFKSEIAKLTEKGGLVDFEGVEKLVQLMLPDRNEKKIDLVCRSMLASVLAATDKFECRSRFVQLKGLPVLDEWLQEVHKGKIGDGSGSKDSDKAVEEFLLVLLRALDKLPINLQALQMCNIGKSVNHLRTHKNLDIQKKARSLVDIWKKRVDAEMKIYDEKAGSSQAVTWPGRPRLSEVSHGGNRHSGGSSEVAVKSSIMQFPGSKTSSVMLLQVESTIKPASASPGSMKLVPSPEPVSVDLKDGQPRSAAVGGTSDLPLATVKDEKGCNSSQSHNNQSFPGDHAKTVAMSGKEDARSSTAGSMSLTKVSGGSSRHRKSIIGFTGAGLSGVQRETGSSRNSSLHRNSPSEKLSQSGLTCEKTLDVPVTEVSNKLIVKIPNRNHSLAQSASGGSFEDPSIIDSRASSPAHSEKHEQFDRSSKEKFDSYGANTTTDVNNESWQSNDFKDAVTGSDEGDASPAAVLDEERCRTGDDTRKIVGPSKAATSSSRSELNPGKLYEASFNSINALIDSCVKYSDTNASPSVGEDVGMNLLASVAAGEIFKSEQVSPIDSPKKKTPVVEHSLPNNDSKAKLSLGGGDDEKQVIIADALWTRNIDGKIKSEEKLAVANNFLISSAMECQQPIDQCSGISGKLNETMLAASVAGSPSCGTERTTNGEGDEVKESKVAGGVSALSIPDDRRKISSSSLAESKDNGVTKSEVMIKAVERSSSCPSLETGVENKRSITDGLKSGAQAVQKPPAMLMHSELMKGNNEELLLPSCSGRDSASDNVAELKSNRAEQMDVTTHVNQTEKQISDQESNAPKGPNDRGVSALGSFGVNHKGKCLEENLGSREAQEQHCSEPASQVVLPTFPVQETEQCLRSRGSKLTGTESAEADECTSTTADATSVSVAGGSDIDAKVEFDLNEGFNADDVKYGEQTNLTAPGSAAVHLISPLPFLVSTGLPASITVAAAAKGPFVPRDDLMRNKGEVGWKGSAATSAFRPAEPRKVLEGTAIISVPDATAGKHSRLPLDIDLNVPDERTLEDMSSRNSVQETGSVYDHTNTHESVQNKVMSSAPGRWSGGLDLDLNQVDEVTDMVNYSTNNGRRLDIPHFPTKSWSGGHPNGKLSVRRDFDLNDGPVADEMSTVPSPVSQLSRSTMPSQPPVSGLRTNNTEIGNFSPWFTSGNTTYSTVSVPSILPDRGDQSFPIVASGGPQRMLGPPTSGSPFSPDVYRGAVLSSSPAMPFQYPVFPFGTSFPLPSATFPVGQAAYVDSSSAGRLRYSTVHSQFLGSPGGISSNYPRPYLIGLPDGSNNGGIESSRKWGRQSLDLNAGPGSLDLGGDDTSPLALRQLSVASSQALAEGQARMYQVAGSVLKRKEPEGGWESYKHSSWQ